MAITIKENQKLCMKCEKVKTKSHFYKSMSEWHGDSTFPYCKHCVKGLVNLDDEYAIHTFLIQLDRPFLSDLWEKAVNDDKETLGRYLAFFNVGGDKNKRYKDGEIYSKKLLSDEHEEQLSVMKEESKDTSISGFKVKDYHHEKWGFGYQPEEYRLFEHKYKKLEKSYSEKTALHTENLLTYIRYRVKEEMAAARGETKDAKEWGQLASKAAQDGKINVSQLSKSDISGGVDVLSQLFEAVETEASVIPLLPQLQEQPYDDADLIIWAIINYYRRLEDKPQVSYRSVWDFYDEMLEEHFKTQDLNEDQIEEYKSSRNNIFRDLENVYKEPLYEGDE